MAVARGRLVSFVSGRNKKKGQFKPTHEEGSVRHLGAGRITEKGMEWGVEKYDVVRKSFVYMHAVSDRTQVGRRGGQDRRCTCQRG